MKSRLNVSDFLGALALSVLFSGASAMTARADDATTSYISGARDLFGKNDLRGAEIQLRNALRRSPKNGEARLLLARVYLRGGAPNTAEAELIVAAQVGVAEARIAPLRAEALYDEGRIGDLLKLIPPGNRPASNESTVRTYRGLAELSLGDTVHAQTDFDNAIKLDGRSPGPRIGMARLYLIKRQLPAAEAMVDGALRQSPKNSDALDVKGIILIAKGDAIGGLARLDASLASNPDNALLDRANGLIGRNQLDKADADIRRVLSVAPESGTANFLSALVNARRGKLQDADAALEKLRPIMEQLPEAYFLAAVVKYNLEQLEQAEAFARRYIAQRPDNAEAYELLGSIALRRGDAAEAVETLEQAYKLAPNDTNAIGLLAEAHMANGDTDKAMVLLDKAVQSQPRDSRLRTQRALGQFASGEESRSLEELANVFQGGKGNSLAGPPLVLSALRVGKIDLASTTAERLVQQDPNNLFNQQLLGVVRMSQHNYAAAEGIFRAALAKSQDLTAARDNLATIYLETNRTDAAQKLYASRLTAVPSDLASAEALARVDVTRKDYNGAIAVLQAAQNAIADNPAPSLGIVELYAQQKKWTEAIRLANSIAVQFTSTEQIYDVLGSVYIASGDARTGVATFKRAVDAFPNSARMWERYAAALANAKDFASALDSLSKAVALDPGNLPYKGELVSLTYQAKGTDAALAAANAMGQGNRNDPVVDILEKQGKRDAAITLLQKVQAANPTVAVLLRLCGLYQESGAIASAVSLASNWVKSHPEDYVARLMLAEFYEASKNFDLAQTNFEQLAAQRPSDPVVLNNLAWLYSRKNDPRALKLAQKAHELAPDSPSISDTLGWIMTNQNDAANGLKLLQTAVAANPDDPTIGFHYAVGLSRTNKVGEARIVLQKILHGNVEFEEKPAAEALMKRLGPAGK